MSRIASMVARFIRLRHQLKRDPQARFYRDLALTPVVEDRSLELFTATDAAITAAAKRKRSVSVEA